jgi:hypothetical protein
MDAVERLANEQSNIDGKRKITYHTNEIEMSVGNAIGKSERKEERGEEELLYHNPVFSDQRRTKTHKDTDNFVT